MNYYKWLLDFLWKKAHDLSTEDAHAPEGSVNLCILSTTWNFGMCLCRLIQRDGKNRKGTTCLKGSSHRNIIMKLIHINF